MHSDELSFEEGATLSLLEQVDGGQWWRATCKGKTGLAPANYIEVTQKSVLQDLKDRVQESDEWDSSEDELDGGGATTITYYYNKAPRSVEISQEMVKNPHYIFLYRAIQ